KTAAQTALNSGIAAITQNEADKTANITALKALLTEEQKTAAETPIKNADTANMMALRTAAGKPDLSVADVTALATKLAKNNDNLIDNITPAPVAARTRTFDESVDALAGTHSP